MTLAEQLIVVGLLGGLGCWGLSCSQEQRHRQRVEAVANEWLAGIQLARAEAERRQTACGLSLAARGWQEPSDGNLPACATALQVFSDEVNIGLRPCQLSGPLYGGCGVFGMCAAVTL